MTRIKHKWILTAVLAGLLIVLTVSGMTVMAADEATTEAEVEVLPQESCSYGDSVVEAVYTVLPVWALGEPDWHGALMLWRGSMTIELERTVQDSGTISIRAAKSGLGNVAVKLYVSSDGKQWKRAGNCTVRSTRYRDYELTGSFGNVKYIKVDRSGGRLALLRLDAVCAKGGD